MKKNNGQPAQRVYKNTKKRKKTYRIEYNVSFSTADFWSQYEQTLLRIAKINEIPQPNDGWNTTEIFFDNPGATEMLRALKNPKWRELMGESAYIITDYMDKETNELVLRVYPTPDCIMQFSEFYDTIDEALMRLNHASRADYERITYKMAQCMLKMKKQQK